MPGSKGLATYPTLFWDICEKVSVSQTEHIIEGVPRKTALGIRQRFYGFRKALEREIKQWGAGMPEPWKDRVQQTILWAGDVVPFIEGTSETVTLRFIHKDMTLM